MQQLSDSEIHDRLEALMARRKNTRPVKYITTNHQKYTMEYERLEGEG